MTKSFLLSATALAVVSTFVALEAHAGDLRPVVQPVSQGFTEASHQAAVNTVTLVQAGTPGGMTSAAQGPVDQSDLPPPQQAVVACPPLDKKDATWQQVPQDIRDQARPGQCFARMLIAPQFENYMDHVMVQQARTETHTTPEVTQLVVKDVMVAPEHVVQRQVAEVSHMEMVTEVVSPATTREEMIPARYETQVQHVLVAPEHSQWVAQAGIPTGAALVTPDDHQPVRYRADGMLDWPGKDAQPIRTSDDTAEYLQRGSGQTVYCLKVIPAVYQDRQVRVEVEPAHARTIDVPAVTRSVRRAVVDVPAHVESVTIPAVYEKRKVREVVTEAMTSTVQIPAVYQDVQKSRMVHEAQPVWREVLCDKNASPDVITAIQHALVEHGYNPGAIDGQLGSQTVSAMQKFEADRGLPQGQVSVEAVQALGVQLH